MYTCFNILAAFVNINFYFLKANVVELLHILWKCCNEKETENKYQADIFGV